MRNFFLTLDLEEWYHLDYLVKYSFDQEDRMLGDLTPFFNLLDKYKIKITVFVLGELIQENKKLIREISNRGHEIGVHGWDHELLHKKKIDDFVLEISRAKSELEQLVNRPVIGYRSPCFSLDNDKMNKLKQIGFKYDSSFIQFDEHPLYGKLDMSGFNLVDDLIYEKEGFYEFELPTYKILGKSIPISGGGYFRLFPKNTFKRIWMKYLNLHNNFTFYIHPFELTDKKVPIKDIGLFDKFRFSVGRKGNLQKLEWFIKRSLSDGFKFDTLSSFINTVEGVEVKQKCNNFDETVLE